MSRKARRSGRPIAAQVGWVDTDVRKDAVELAKGSAHKYLDAPEIAYYAVLPMLGGHLWEIQEGGDGRSYLPAIAEALAKGVEPAWFRAGLKAHTFALRDSRPYCMILNKEDSRKLVDSDIPELRPRNNMDPVVRKGRKMFAVGLTLFSTGFLFMAASVGAYAGLERMLPDARVVDVDLLPHRQWQRVERTPQNLFVESLKLTGTQWATSTKPVMRIASDSQSGPNSATAKAPTGAMPPTGVGAAPRPPGPVSPPQSASANGSPGPVPMPATPFPARLPGQPDSGPSPVAGSGMPVPPRPMPLTPMPVPAVPAPGTVGPVVPVIPHPTVPVPAAAVPPQPAPVAQPTVPPRPQPLPVAPPTAPPVSGVPVPHPVAAPPHPAPIPSAPVPVLPAPLPVAPTPPKPVTTVPGVTSGPVAPAAAHVVTPPVMPAPVTNVPGAPVPPKAVPQPTPQTGPVPPSIPAGAVPAPAKPNG